MICFAPARADDCQSHLSGRIVLILTTLAALPTPTRAAIPGIEFAALKMLVEAEADLRREGVTPWRAALNAEVLEMLRHSPLAEALGRQRMFFTVEEAVAASQERMPGVGSTGRQR